MKFCVSYSTCIYSSHPAKLAYYSVGLSGRFILYNYKPITWYCDLGTWVPLVDPVPLSSRPTIVEGSNRFYKSAVIRSALTTESQNNVAYIIILSQINKDITTYINYSRNGFSSYIMLYRGSYIIYTNHFACSLSNIDLSSSAYALYGLS